MSLLRGQHGSQERHDFVPSTGQFASKGNYLDPNQPSALGVEDRSRFRPQSFVAPRQVELMQGALTTPGAANYTGREEPQVRAAGGWFMSR
jgi:hypothetical protein